MEALFGSKPYDWTQLVVPAAGMTVVPLGATLTQRLHLYPIPVAVLSTPRDLAVLVRPKTQLAGLAGLAGSVEFVAEDSAAGAAVAYEPLSAMPIRLYSVPVAGAEAGAEAEYVLQVPSGMFDIPNTANGGDTYTFFSHAMRYTAASYANAPRWPASALILTPKSIF